MKNLKGKINWHRGRKEGWHTRHIFLKYKFHCQFIFIYLWWHCSIILPGSNNFYGTNSKNGFFKKSELAYTTSFVVERLPYWLVWVLLFCWVAVECSTCFHIVLWHACVPSNFSLAFLRSFSNLLWCFLLIKITGWPLCKWDCLDPSLFPTTSA